MLCWNRLLEMRSGFALSLWQTGEISSSQFEYLGDWTSDEDGVNGFCGEWGDSWEAVFNRMDSEGQDLYTSELSVWSVDQIRTDYMTEKPKKITGCNIGVRLVNRATFPFCHRQRMSSSLWNNGRTDYVMLGCDIISDVKLPVKTYDLTH